MKHHRCLFLFSMIGATVVSAALPGILRCQSGPASTEALTKRAEVVAVGRVTAMRSEWDQNKTRIVTRVTMTVGEYLKGNAGSVMMITSPGGEVDGVGEWYSHCARFRKDEEIVVFAEKDTKGRFRVSGGQDGKISIVKDQASGQSRVSARMTLDDLKARIKDAVQTQDIK